MGYTIFAIFADGGNACKAVGALVDAGFGRGLLDIMLKSANQNHDPFLFERFFTALLKSGEDAKVFSTIASIEGNVVSLQTESVEEAIHAANILTTFSPINVSSWMKNHQMETQLTTTIDRQVVIVNRTVEESARLREERIQRDGDEQNSIHALGDLESLIGPA